MQWQLTGNANWIKGKHNVRFGLDFSLQDLNHLQPEFYGGTWGAPGGYTEITSTRGTGSEGIDERQFRFGIRLAF